MPDTDIAELIECCRRTAPVGPVTFTAHRWLGLVGGVALAANEDLSRRDTLGVTTAHALAQVVAEACDDGAEVTPGVTSIALEMAQEGQRHLAAWTCSLLAAAADTIEDCHYTVLDLDDGDPDRVQLRRLMEYQVHLIGETACAALIALLRTGAVVLEDGPAGKVLAAPMEVEP